MDRPRLSSGVGADYKHDHSQPTGTPVAQGGSQADPAAVINTDITNALM